MRILVTSGAGCSGSSLAEPLPVGAHETVFHTAAVTRMPDIAACVHTVLP